MKLQFTSSFLLLLGIIREQVTATHYLPSFDDAVASERIPPPNGAADTRIFGQSKPWQGKLIQNRRMWRVTCDNSASKEQDCKNVIDGRNATIWYAEGNADHNVVIDMRSPANVNAISMLPRQDGKKDGHIKRHQIFLSQDGRNWGEPVAYGTWSLDSRLKLAIFEPVKARFVKLVAGPGPISVCDLNVYATKYTIPQNASLGRWGPTIDLPLTPVSGANGADETLLLWSSWAEDQFHASPGGKTIFATWDPSKQTVSESKVNNTRHDMFCPGTSMDGDGRIVVTGGNDAAQTSIYDPKTGEWIRGPPMKHKRGYQSSATLSDGRAFVIGGSWNGGSRVFKNGEIFDPIKSEWKLLPGAKVKPMLTHDRQGNWRADNHGWLFGWKNETVFQAGPSKAMHWYSVDGRGSIENAGNRVSSDLEDQDAMSGNAVMFDATKGKILTFGGSPNYDNSNATNHAHLITITDPLAEPTVETAGNGGMHYNRTFHTSVVLPDGSVFIAGGQSYGIAFNEENVHFVPELYDPKTNTFVELQQNNMIRVYHSVSLLQPDARVLNLGGGLCGACPANHYDAQIFTPPYLLEGDGTEAKRPVITSVSADEVTVGGELIVSLDSASTFGSASLIRQGSATHTVNTDQRRVPLEGYPMGRKGNRYVLELEADPGILLPGYYMLFIMNDKGVPSEAKTIKVALDASKKGVVDELDPQFHNDDDDCEEGMLAMVAAVASKLRSPWSSALVRQIPWIA